MTLSRCWPVLLVMSLACGCSGLPTGSGAAASEGTSLLGSPLLPLDLPADTLARRTQQYESALAAARKAPRSSHAAIWLGRRLAYLGRYREAIEVYTDAMEDHPRDARLWRHRGHRWLSLRELDRARVDLEHAAGLVRGLEDSVEPDGLPNALNIPTSTLHGNIAYHLGLTCYLQGDFDGSLRAFLWSSSIARNPDMLSAANYWLTLTLIALGRDGEARELLATIDDQWEIIENHDYHRMLLLFASDDGARGEELLSSARESGGVTFATVGYGISCWLDWQEKGGGRELRSEIIAAGDWPAFGHIAAEAAILADESHADGNPESR
ncbi:MAG TPA: hypothetical protein EYN79_10695 [Planctomycetes bacterium]|nr:hypothetical protein [Planctomycetota bacterium]